MEQQLLKLARQLDAFDEASLMALWERCAAIVDRFEPSRRWEEAALVLSLIQAKRWKNQLFNHQWASRVRSQGVDAAPPRVDFDLERRPASGASPLDEGRDGRPADGKKRGKVLRFGPVEDD